MMFYEQNPEIRLSKGEVLLNGGYPEDALPYLERELALHPGNPAIYVNLGSCHKFIGNYAKAEEYLTTALRMNPNIFQARHNLALVYGEMGRFKEELDAWVSAAIATTNENTQFGLANAMMRSRKFSMAAPIWEAARLGKRSCCILPNLAVWRGQNLAGKKILVTREGGHGDIFWLMRYLEPLKEMGAWVACMVYRQQKELLQGHPWIDRILTSEDALNVQEYDYQIPLWSIMTELLKLGVPIPLRIDEPYIHAKNPVGHPPMTIGICWETGEMTSVHRKMRVIQEPYLPILANIPVNWVSLIPGNKPDWCSAVCPAGWRETADFMASLDLVISVDTSVMHLAGAMGIPTWLPLPIGSAWFYFDDVQRCSWYPSVRLFRNTDPVSFQPVVEEMAGELTKWVEAHTHRKYQTLCAGLPIHDEVTA